MDEIEKILNQDTMKGGIDELCNDMENFDDIRFLCLLWSNGKRIKSRYYGEIETLIAQLEASKQSLLSEFWEEGNE